ncbi:unnamed protein product [Adineta steineri]|uniref:Uncharacterized protein n=1 Tax=Adineta steineri TaxID=433720 RepID=A0A814Z9H4_9BILA|nr:unnamed protein product [Adineta steineri]
MMMNLNETKYPFYSYTPSRYAAGTCATIVYISSIAWLAQSLYIKCRPFPLFLFVFAAYLTTFIELILRATLNINILNTKILYKMTAPLLKISSGFLSLPADDWTELVKLVLSYDLKAKPEVGIQWGAGGDASIEELENAGTRDPKWLIDRAKRFLDAGAYMIMIESEGITENVKSWRTDVISSITSNLPQDKIMFEAADPEVFAYHIQNSGAHANLFIDHSQIVQLACLRKGIWGTDKTFGRIVTFQD